MKKFFFKKAISITTLILLSFSYILAEASVQQENDEKVIVIVNDNKITLKEMKKKIDQIMATSGMAQKIKWEELDPNGKKELIRSIVISDLLSKEADLSDIKNDPSFKEALINQTESLKQKAFLDKIAAENLDESALKKEYKKLKKDAAAKKEYKASHILLNTKEEAVKIKERITAGEEFEDLANKNSKDSTSKGGDLGYFTQGRMVPNFEKAVEDMKIGEVSSPVETEFGWHIIKLIDVRDAKFPEYTAMKDEIKNTLMQKNFYSYLEKLQAKNKIEYFVE